MPQPERSGHSALAYCYRGGPASTGVDMADQKDFGRFIEALRGRGDRILIVVEDPEADNGWKIVTEADLAELWQSVQSSKPESNGAPRMLCYNVEQAAKALGVSVHKLNGWLRRAEAPVPHIQDGRRILIPCHLLIQWLTEEAGKNLGFGED